jgi:hypothetical protein
MIDRVEDFLNQHKILRRGTLLIALWLTWEVSKWSMWFAVENSRNGVEIAAILASVQAPITIFTGMIFKSFVDSKAA